MQPYVVRQGDYLARLAYRLAFDANTVWADGKNASLRGYRDDPNILAPGDVLYVPDDGLAGKPAATPVTTGTTNDFVASPPSITVKVRFLDEELRSQPCTVAELPGRVDLQTDGDGILSLALPVDLDAATITFPGPGIDCVLLVGYLDPIATITGVQHRLQNLGYLDDSVPDDAADPDAFGALLWRLGQDSGASGTPDDPGGPPSDPNAILDGVNDSCTSKRLGDAHGS